MAENLELVTYGIFSKQGYSLITWMLERHVVLYYTSYIGYPTEMNFMPDCSSFSFYFFIALLPRGLEIEDCTLNYFYKTE